MIFGSLPLAEAEGAILAHSMSLGAQRLKKGRVLGAGDIAALAAAGHATVVAARLGPDDLDEDRAASAVAAALADGPAGCGLSLSVPFTGRANLFADTDGVLRVDAAAIAAVNAIDEAVTVATLPDFARVSPRQMVATVKIIPYAAPRTAVEEACAVLRGSVALRVHPFAADSVTLVLTATPGMKRTLLDKGADAVRQRLRGLGIVKVEEVTVAHETAAIEGALRVATGALVLILTASATSDRRDVGPAAVVAAGGRIERFGMPVDPGNLLFLGELAGRPVVGLPGCARSPKLNGADWVLERLAARLPVGDGAIAAMGVGGLLKEIPARPEPRAGGARASRRPVIAAVLLAAGAGTRMGGKDKLLETVHGVPMLRHAAKALIASRADQVLAVLDPARPERAVVLDGCDVTRVSNHRAADGMGTSIAAAIAQLEPQVDAVVFALADMPEITPLHVDRLIAAFDPEEGRAICRAATADGRPGHPVLFGRRFFETLGRLEGDEGARTVVAEHPDLVETVMTPGDAAIVDLDTPEAWAAWRAAHDGEARQV
jgi:molybdenum cofactor cytidylyltransferase